MRRSYRCFKVSDSRGISYLSLVHANDTLVVNCTAESQEYNISPVMHEWFVKQQVDSTYESVSTFLHLRLQYNHEISETTGCRPVAGRVGSIRSVVAVVVVARR